MSRVAQVVLAYFVGVATVGAALGALGCTSEDTALGTVMAALVGLVVTIVALMG